MYAVVSTGGKQLKVEEGTEAVVEKLDAPVGDTVTLDVLFVADDGQIVSDADALGKASVSAEVVEHFLGDKQVVFKFKRRKGYKRLKGHRQQQTRIRVTGIDATAAKKAAKAAPKPKKAEEKPAAKAKEKVEEAAAAVEKTAKKAEASVKEAAEKTAETVEKAAEKVEKKTKKAAEKTKDEVEKAAEKVEEKVEKPAKAKAKKKADAEPALCAATKADGTPCKNKAKEGSEYCGVHAKKYDK